MSGVIREIELPIHTDPARGKLVPIELDSAIPFTIKRTYYLWNVPKGVMRGGHAHTIEKEFFVCIRGKCHAKISTDGDEPYKISMHSPNRGLFVDNLVWHEFTDFSPDAILLCFSSTNYLPDNYINSFEEFKGVIQK